MDEYIFTQISVSFFIITVSTIFSRPIVFYILPIFPSFGSDRPFIDEYKKMIREMKKDSCNWNYWFASLFFGAPVLCGIFIGGVDSSIGLEVDIDIMVKVYSVLWGVFGFFFLIKKS